MESKLTIRFTKEQVEILKKYAKLNGHTVSSLIRTTMIDMVNNQNNKEK